MDTSAVGSGTYVTSAHDATTRGFGDMSSEDFFGLLIAELQMQDPMNPTDNQQLLQQMSTIRGMEQTATLTETLTSLASEQRFSGATSLIGHYIAGTVTDSSGGSYELQGLVIGVRFDADGDAILELHNGQEMPASKVEQVTLVENLPADILEQLEAELAAMEESEGDSTAARSIVADAGSVKSASAASAKAGASEVQQPASLLERLLSPLLS